MKPLFAVLKANHMGRTILPAQVYEAIGHLGLEEKPEWANTCAVRMSVALIAAGVKIRPGRLRIRAGRFKDEMVEPGQRRLSEFLVTEIGQPERYKGGANGHNAIAWRTGIVSFFQIHGGGNQGHIDLVSVQEWPDLLCNGSCYWDSVDVWFWPLK